MRCSNCNREITQQSSFCPTCGASLEGAKAPSKNKTNLKIVLIILGVVIGSCVFLVVIGMIQQAVNPDKDLAKRAQQESTDSSRSDAPRDTGAAEPEQSAPPEREISKVTWEEIDRIYNLRSNATDAQKSAMWKNYKGKVVEWEGEVADIKEGYLSGYTLHIKMNKETLTSDLMIGLDDSQQSKVMSLTKGSRIRFIGTLNNWGSLLPITLEDGEIK